MARTRPMARSASMWQWLPSRNCRRRLASAVPGPPDQVILFYGEAYSMVKYLVETYGKDNMQKLLGVFKKGSSVDDAIKAVYGFNLQEFDTRWRASLGAPSSVINTPAAG